MSMVTQSEELRMEEEICLAISLSLEAQSAASTPPAYSDELDPWVPWQTHTLYLPPPTTTELTFHPIPTNPPHVTDPEVSSSDNGIDYHIDQRRSKVSVRCYYCGVTHRTE